MLKKGFAIGLIVIAGIGAARPPGDAPAPAPGPAPAGRVEMTFTERSPEGALDEVIRRTDVDMRAYKTEADAQGAKAQWTYDLAKQTFDVVTPAAYQKTDPHGLFVWMGSEDVPGKWFDALARHKLIYVSARDLQGRVSIVREGLALDAAHNLLKRYTIDPERVYVAGFSTGAQAAAWLVRAYPEVFRGGIFMMGGSFYKTYEGIDGWFFGSYIFEEKRYASAFGADPQWKGPLEQMKNNARLVIVRGEKDDLFEGALKDGRDQYEGLVLDGFVRTSYLEAGGGHVIPDATTFEKALVALEAQPAVAPTTAPTRDPQPGEAQVLQAKRLLTTAQHGAGDMKALLTRIVEDYPTTPSAQQAKEGLDWLEREAKNKQRK